MDHNDASQTIVGSYRTVNIDGEDVLMEQVKDPDGKLHWVPVSYRLSLEKEFDRRWADTSTVPGSWKPTDTKILEPKTGHQPTTRPQTSRNLNGFLVSVYGIPTDIITNRGIDEGRKKSLRGNRVAIASHIEVVKALNDEKWNQVLPYMRALYLE